jgi:small nuclear ribonucleoprotein (snRNP)-like protein
MAYVNWRMRITISDTRQLVGTFLAFDRHMNLVLADTEEYRKIKPKKGKRRQNTREETGDSRGSLLFVMTLDAELFCWEICALFSRFVSQAQRSAKKGEFLASYC